MTTPPQPPRAKRYTRTKPSDVKITDRPVVMPEEPTPVPAVAVEALVTKPVALAADEPAEDSRIGVGVVTVVGVVEPVPGAPIEDPFIWIVQNYGDPRPATVDEYVNAALLAATDPRLEGVTDVIGAAARWAIEGITALPREHPGHIARPGSAAEEAARLEEQEDLHRLLSTLEVTLTNRAQLIATALNAAGREAPTEAPGGYRADLAGVIATWLDAALERMAARTATPVVELTNADTLNTLAEQHRLSVGQ